VLGIFFASLFPSGIDFYIGIGLISWGTQIQYVFNRIGYLENQMAKYIVYRFQ
jgi:hypothetical protein